MKSFKKKKFYKIQFILTSIFYILSIVILSIFYIKKHYQGINLLNIVFITYHIILLILSTHEHFYDFTKFDERKKNIIVGVAVFIFLSNLLLRNANENIFVKVYEMPVIMWLFFISPIILLFISNLISYKEIKEKE